MLDLAQFLCLVCLLECVAGVTEHLDRCASSDSGELPYPCRACEV